MNAITQYMDVLKAENDNLWNVTIFFTIVCLLLIAGLAYQKDKLDDTIRKLKSELASIKYERDQLQLDNVNLRKQNNETELSNLKKQLHFALKHPPKFPVGTEFSHWEIRKIEIKMPGFAQYASLVLKGVFSGIGSVIKNGLPKPYYVYHINSSYWPSRELLEHELDEFIKREENNPWNKKLDNKSKPTKKTTRKPRKNGNKKTSPAGIKKS